MHKDALDALTDIEVEFANLRDKYVYVSRLHSPICQGIGSPCTIH